jgi:hypothetical protein
LLLLSATAFGETPTTVRTIPARDLGAVSGQAVFDPAQNEVGQFLYVLYGTDGQPVAGAVSIGGFMGVGVRKIAVAWHLFRISIVDGQANIAVGVPMDILAAARDMDGPDDTINIVDIPK